MRSPLCTHAEGRRSTWYSHGFGACVAMYPTVSRQNTSLYKLSSIPISTPLSTITTMTSVVSGNFHNSRFPFGIKDQQKHLPWPKHDTSPSPSPRQAKSIHLEKDPSFSSFPNFDQARRVVTKSPTVEESKPSAQHPEQLLNTQETTYRNKMYRESLYSQWTGNPRITAKFEYIPNIDQLGAIDKLADVVFSMKTVRSDVREKLGWDWKRVSQV